jgi:hypothetical protein
MFPKSSVDPLFKQILATVQHNDESFQAGQPQE